MSVTSVRLQPDVEKELAQLAERLDRSRNWLINEAVREYAARQAQGQARWSDTLEAMASVAEGRVVPAESVHAWLASWGSEDELPPPRVDG